MTGFYRKNVVFRVLVTGVWIVALASCASLSPSQDPAVEPGLVTAEEPESKSAPEQAVIPSEPLTAPLLFQVLLAEIAGQRGALDVSGASYLQAAKTSNDPRIAERAFKVAIFAKQPVMALEAARRWVALEPNNTEARQSLAVLALRAGNKEEALQQFEFLLQEQNESETDLYQVLPALLARDPDKQSALSTMEQLVALHPDNADAHFSYARLAVHAQDWLIANQQLQETLRLKPGYTPALILQAQVSVKQGKPDVARRQIEAALQEYPDDELLRLAYARLLVDAEQLDDARREYERLQKLQPDNGKVVYSLALLQLDAGELDKARILLERQVELDFQKSQAWYYLGAIAEERKQYDRAMQWYGKIEDGEDHWIDVQIRMARMETNAGEVEAARERLQMVRTLQPSQAQRMFLIEGELLTQIDWYEEAFTLYSQYLEIRPDDLEVLYARALVADRLGRLKYAEQDLQKILAADPGNSRALNALGYILANKTTRYTEALKYIEEALAAEPDDPAVLDSMGWVLFKMNRLADAREPLQKAYDLTGDAEIAAHLGEVMWNMGDKSSAIELWKQAREREAGNKVLEDTIRRLAP